MFEAFRMKCPSSTAKLVLLALAWRANRRGVCFPSIASIAEDTGLSMRGVGGALQLLAAGSFIAIKHGSNHLGRTSSTYRLTLDQARAAGTVKARRAVTLDRHDVPEPPARRAEGTYEDNQIEQKEALRDEGSFANVVPIKRHRVRRGKAL